VAPEVKEAKCVVLIDPWYPAIPKQTRSSLAKTARCPMLVFGSSAFNKKRKDGRGLFCEGTSAGLQDSILSAYSGPDGSRGSMLVVPSDSHHAMVDDLGAVFKDKCALVLVSVQRPLVNELHVCVHTHTWHCLSRCIVRCYPCLCTFCGAVCRLLQL
jgi:hypothetical protein